MTGKKQGVLDITRAQIPTPFPIGDTNTYIINSSKLTLIDVGTKMDGSIQDLEKAFAGIGKNIEDLDQIIITHAHADHYGLAREVKERSGAKVLLHEREKKGVESFMSFSALEEEYAEPLFKAGLPKSLIDQQKEFQSGVINFVDPVDVDVLFKGGDEIDVGETTLGVIDTPGHTPGSSCFHYREEGILISADTLLERTIPIAFSTTEDEKHGLYNYTQSLRKLDAMDLNMIYPGHGDPFADYHAAIARYFERHEKRKQKLLGILKNKEKTAFQLAAAAFDNLAFVKIYLNLNEIIGYADVLVQEGAVTVREKNGRLYYTAANNGSKGA